MAQHLAKVVKKAPKIGAAIGKVVDKNGHYKAVKVKVEEVKFNDFLNMYFSEYPRIWASDEKSSCEVGDIVYVRKLQTPTFDRVHHYVHRLVFRPGEVIDPVTGKRCRGPEFIKEDMRNNFGQLLPDEEAPTNPLSLQKEESKTKQ